MLATDVKFTPLMSKVLEILAQGMVLLRSEELNADFANQFGFKIKLIMRTITDEARATIKKTPNKSEIQEKVAELMQILAEEIHGNNPNIATDTIAIDLDIALANNNLSAHGHTVH